jgi:hypothetical protein
MRHGRIIGAVWVALGVAALWPASAAADDAYVVTRTDDTPTCVPLVDCSLRGAIALANADADNDVVVLAPGDHTLALGQLAVTAPLTVVSTGTARNTSVKGGGSRVFKTTADTVMAGFTIREGTGRDDATILSANNDRGGGIWQAAGSLVFANMRITANQVDNAATASGGGIQHEGAGTLILAATLIDGNTAKAGTANGQIGRGGGLFAAASSGAVSVASATFTANTATGFAGSQGGGIATVPGSSVALVNATVAGNTASGAGTLGGNVAPGGPVSARNTIVSGGTAPAGANCSGALASLGNNLEPGTSCGLVGAGDRNAEPALGPLADNGGPTDTLAITTTSPAFDAGTDSGCPPIDQRGQARPQGAVCDIGALEVIAPRPSAGGTGGGAGGTGAGGATGADLRPPVIGGLSFAPPAFRAATSGALVRPARARRRPPVGGVVRHTLSERAVVAYLVERRRGRRWVALRGAFARTGTAGANRFRFSGRVAGRRLAPGRYRLVAIARDAAGNPSKVARREFRVVR